MAVISNLLFALFGKKALQLARTPSLAIYCFVLVVIKNIIQ
jgi:hypothetical protein